jgi:hypothetical protein
MRSRSAKIADLWPFRTRFDMQDTCLFGFVIFALLRAFALQAWGCSGVVVALHAGTAN